jgi:SAM-dependent methyltransferase
MRNPTKRDLRSGEPTLDTAALEMSEVVANASMNRERNLAGPNSYEKDLGFNALDWLKKRLEEHEEAAWLDLCCGTGRALIQAAEASRAAGLERKLKFTGVDLVPLFDATGLAADGLRLVAASLEKWNTADRVDLITCVHGLHYIGDKLGLLARASGWLKSGGLLLAHLDYRNLRIKGRESAGAQIGKDLRRAGFEYIAGRHLMTCRAQTTQKVLPYRYLGADDQAGPNYTGQPAVDSYYERISSRAR